MSRLTETAKSKLEELISGQLREMSEAVRSENEPAIKQLEHESEQLAIESLGISEAVEKCCAILKTQKELLEELEKLQGEQDQILGKPSESYHGYGRNYRNINENSGCSHYAEQLLPARKAHHIKLLFAETEFGQRLNLIKRKEGSISKDILLATLPEQLTAVYMRFCEDFGIEP